MDGHIINPHLQFVDLMDGMTTVSDEDKISWKDKNGKEFKMDKKKYEHLKSIGRTYLLLIDNHPHLVSKEIFTTLVFKRRIFT